MDLGIKGRNAIVCGASRGLGYACAQSLAREGVNVTIVARTADKIEQAAKELRAATGAAVTPVAADISTPEGRAALVAACPAPDILVTNAGGPPAGDYRKFTLEDWHRALETNMLAPIELIRLVIDGMIARRFGRIVNITSGAVKHPIDVITLSAGPRAGLTGYVGGVSREVAQHNVTINNILPGFHLTERSKITMTALGAKAGRTFEEHISKRLESIPARRSGDPAELGDACAFLCSAQAGYIVGQNLLIDGGAFPGLF